LAPVLRISSDPGAARPEQKVLIAHDENTVICLAGGLWGCDGESIHRAARAPDHCPPRCAGDSRSVTQ